ncbi:unnamed protein product [Rhizophagus irregularis]|nr:unnamed protein product [Rhizophagus irregularis]CAB5360321.1 unnamed protein product [Rhizophagus irregularis]
MDCSYYQFNRPDTSRADCGFHNFINIFRNHYASSTREEHCSTSYRFVIVDYSTGLILVLKRKMNGNETTHILLREML